MMNVLAPATAAAHNGLSVETAQTITQNTIYLMGFSFIIGSLFTIFVLIVLDFMRRNREGGKQPNVPFGERHQAQKTKNIALGLALLALIAMFFAITLIRFGAQ